MKKIILFTLIFTATHCTVTAQLSEGTKDSAMAEIQQLANEWNKAIINRDSLTLDKILAAEYTLYSYNGSSANRMGWLNNTLHRFTTDTAAFLASLNITVYGQAAKSEGTLYWKAAWDGKPRVNADFSVTDIWIKRDGHWQVLMRMSQLAKNR